MQDRKAPITQSGKPNWNKSSTQKSILAEQVNNIAEQHRKMHASLILSERHHYQFLDVHSSSMDDGSSKSLCIGDVLHCREIEQWNKVSDLNNLKYQVVVVTDAGKHLGIITRHERGVITLHHRNADYMDLVIPCSEIETIYLVESHQRDMVPEATAGRSRNN